MDSVLHLLSQFTPEALLLEGALFLLLLAGYAAFWLLSKRRLGVIQTAVPSGVIKIYLNELIEDAERLRAQLFGILRAAGVKLSDEEMKAALSTGLLRTAGTVGGTLNIPVAGQLNPALGGQMGDIEKQMTEQARALETLGLEKNRLEQELLSLKSSGGGGGAGGGGNEALIAELQKKIRELEDRLAEYAVIEDDLANLKRLQQENAQLKAALAAGGGAVAAGAAVPAPQKAAPVDPLDDINLAPPPAEPAPAAEAPPAPAAPPREEPAATAPAVDMLAEAAPTPPLLGTGAEKSEADLVAEFEKLLGS